MVVLQLNNIPTSPDIVTRSQVLAIYSTMTILDKYVGIKFWGFFWGGGGGGGVCWNS